MPSTLTPVRKRFSHPVFPVAPRPSGAQSESCEAAGQAAGLAAAATLVLWVGCVLVGGLGFALPYGRPEPPAPEPAPILAEKLAVTLTADPQPAPAAPTPVDPLTAPPPAPPVAVAEPSPALAFALPVTGAVRVVDASKASSARTAPAASSTGAPVQPLVFGRGEGRQPAPVYPSTAIRQGQEGTVVVRLTVDTGGRVLSAEASSPSPWPLLNESALRAVRERWRFSPGARRTYEVPVRFTLQK